MKKQFEQSQRLLHSHGRLFLVGLATLLLVGLLPHWVSAEGATAGATFTSPLPKPTHVGDDLRDQLRTIIDRDALTAEVLGISVDELKTARESGVRLDELITQLGLDEATVHQELQTAFTQAVEQAVADGKLTQEQANLVLTPPAPRGGEGHQHGPDQGSGDHQPGGTPAAHTTPAPTSATPAAAASATNATTTAAATPSAPERHPHDRRDNVNAPGQQTNNTSTENTTTSNSTASNSAAANANSATTTQAGTNETGGSRNRPNGNRHGR